MSKMEPCPACRSTRVYVMRSLTETSAAGNLPKVQCPDCCCVGPVAETSDEAIRAWNAIPRAPVQPTKTLRDEFAMAALSGLLARMRPDAIYTYEDLVAQAYAIADAMMKEREKADD